MSRLLESESDAGSTSSNVESMKSERNPYTVQDELEEYAKKLNLLALGEDRNELQLGDGSSVSLEESTGNNKTGNVVVSTAPRTTSPILTHLSPAGHEAVKQVLSKTQGMPKKLRIKFQAIGSVAQVSPQSAQISSSQPFSVLVTFLRKKLKLATVYCYVNNSFSPAPQQSIGDLWNHFRVKDELIVNYFSGVAFG
ncbi:LANO_0F02696g1_1 [Lachancea nothofagi CBS 11611]|uniref:Ubiquitin-like protein ATG12 n=1 Tax=Lachancea nothofagi CBS 11611 TaxID=1266666 RepID=A0A1G4K6W2_9SACH|nr:LANO_0F02696g1_1 [Lachancea nothofagi CBS 11611]